MNIYIDESGSINNLLKNEPFVITLVIPDESGSLKKSYKRFISSNYDNLKILDKKKRMFNEEKFKELKGSSFNKKMKENFVTFFSEKQNFSLYYIVVDNSKLTDNLCSNSSRAFNYFIKIALDYFIKNQYLPSEDHILQLDERNERTESKYFLEDYLNTELTITGINNGEFTVHYFDSSNNSIIQIADVFSNIYYSHLKTNSYHNEINKLKDANILKFIFEFPL